MTSGSGGMSPGSEDQTLDLSIKRDLSLCDSLIAEVIGPILQEEPIDFSTKKSEHRMEAESQPSFVCLTQV